MAIKVVFTHRLVFYTDAVENFKQRHPDLIKEIRRLLFFCLFSFFSSIVQYSVFSFLPHILGMKYAAIPFLWPEKTITLFGYTFTWSMIGFDVLYDSAGSVMIGGGLGYFISYMVGTLVAQLFNFPFQRNITFKSKGNVYYQLMWYLIAWLIISFLSNGFNNLWMPVVARLVSPYIYNIIVTAIAGTFAMIVYYFVYKIIFPEGKKN